MAVLTLVSGLLFAQVADDGDVSRPGKVLWDGGFDEGTVPAGVNGPSCDIGGTDVFDEAAAGSDSAAGNAADARGPVPPRGAYGSVQEMGNSACRDVVELSDEKTRTEDSERSLKVVMAAGQQREQLQSTYTWTPDDTGSIEEWYGFSFFYARDWERGRGVEEGVSATYWHNPVAWRVDGPNGSLNLSGDMNLDNADGGPFETFSTPHMVLRRNTVLNGKGFYSDGLGLDKLDLGPIVTGEWMDFVCHVRWSTTAEGALRECWRDGEYKGSRTSSNAVSADPHTLRVGQYQSTRIDARRTTYVDNVRIGTSYAAVDPARDRS